MSLIELILAQKAILLTLVIAVMILMAAVVLAIMPRIKASNAKKARQKVRAETLAQQRALEQAEAAESEELAAVAAEAQAEVQVTPPAPAPAPVAPPVVKAAKAAPVAAPVPPKPAPAPAPTPVASSGGGTSSAMQDILSSVFANDEAMARYEVLLRGLDNVDIDDLLALCNQVADQLRTGNMAVVND